MRKRAGALIVGVLVVALGTVALIAPAEPNTDTPSRPPGSSSAAPSTSGATSSSGGIPASPQPASITTMPQGDVVSHGTTWTPVFAEDYNTPAALGSVLRKYPEMGAYSEPEVDTSGQGLYSPSRVLSVHDSLLDFYLHSENGQPLVATVLPDDYAPHLYARVSIRYRADPVPGYKLVTLLWPTSNNWNEGEIDWPEGDLTGRVRPVSAIAGSYDPLTGRMKFTPHIRSYAPTDQTRFHTATTEWTPGVLRFYWDGRLIDTLTKGVPSTPMRLGLQAETFIHDGPVPGDTAGHLQVDWIEIYKRS